MTGLFDNNYKSLKKEIEENTRKLKNFLCSWIGRINIVQMAMLPETIYRFNAIPINVPSKIFTDLERTLIHFIWEYKIPRRAKTILYNNRYSRGITIQDVKLYYKITVLKTVWYWHKNREVNLCNQIWDPDISLQTYEHLILTRELKVYSGRRIASLTNGVGITWCQPVEEWK